MTLVLSDCSSWYPSDFRAKCHDLTQILHSAQVTTMSHNGEMGVLPDFEQPPVVEVAMSLQFKPLESLGASHLGLLWAELRRKGLSRAEDHGELERAFEDFRATPARRAG